MVAVAGEQVIGGAEKLLGDVFENGVDLGLGGECETVENLAFEGAAWRFGLRARPVYAGQAGPVVSAVGVFPAVDDDARVEEGGADGPEDGG